MSKYLQRGAYHYDLFATPGDPYREHVLDLVQQIGKVAPKNASILEVGAGEGLILSRLEELGYDVAGCDTDREACRLANMKGNEVWLGTLHRFADRAEFDVVLFSDSLEHIEDPDEAIAIAQQMAPVLVIAIPDRNDRHAVRQMVPSDVIKWIGDGWELVHSDTRCARHLMVFQRVAEEETVPALDEESEFDL